MRYFNEGPLINCLLLLALLTLIPVTANANNDISMVLKPGVGGQAVDGQFAEIEISLFSSTPVEGILEITDALGISSFPITLDELKIEALWIAVLPAGIQPVQVILRTSDGGRIKDQISFNRHTSPLLIISSDVSDNSPIDQFGPLLNLKPLKLPANHLPHTAQAYSAVEAVITSVDALSKLNQQQYLALENYLRQCRILFLASKDMVLMENLKTLSGCSGRFIHHFDTFNEVEPLLRKLSGSPLHELPEPADMMSLKQDMFPHNTIAYLSLYLIGYVLILFLFNCRISQTAYLLLLPFFTAGVGLLAWTGPGTHELISWAETESNSSYINISNLLLAGGDRRGDSRITLSSAIHLSQVDSSYQRPLKLYSEDRTHYLLQTQGPLLSSRAIYFTTVIKQQQSVNLFIKNERPAVRFTEHRTAAARLLWRGHIYDVPSGAKDEIWQPHSASGHPPEVAEEKLLKSRIPYNAAALLLPFEAPQTSVPGSHNRGWLVVRQGMGNTL